MGLTERMRMANEDPEGYRMLFVEQHPVKFGLRPR